MRPPPSSEQPSRPPAHRYTAASTSRAADTTGRENGAAHRAVSHAAASTQTLAVNPLLSEDHAAEDGWGQQAASGAAASPELVELQRAYGKQVGCQEAHRITAVYMRSLESLLYAVL